MIRCETEFALVLYRTQLFDPGDIENVKSIQGGYKVQTLSSYLGQSAPATKEVAFLKPLSSDRQRSSAEFFDVLDFVLRYCPVHPSEIATRERFAKLGIGSGFQASKLSSATVAAVEAGIADAWAAFAQNKLQNIDTGKTTAADGFGTRAYLNGRYLDRMTSAVLGIYGNSKEEAIYPVYFVDALGEKLDASKRAYTLRFPPDGLPPADAFWSLTMYRLPESLLVANRLNRYLINSPMLPKLNRDADGGLTLFLQHDSPGEGREANWLPAPAGPFVAVLRLYQPKAAALLGEWKARPLQPANAVAAQTATVPVTVENFVRAESDLYFGGIVKDGGFGRFNHNREMTPLDRQVVIRMNRDTLYSGAVFDLDAGPVKITLPESHGRFLSMQIIDEDHYVHGVFYGAGAHTLSRAEIGTRYVAAAIRVLADPNKPGDFAEAHRLQDAIKVDQAARGEFKVPPWNPASQKTVRDALVTLGTTLPDTRGAFGEKGRVDPVRHLIGSAMAWGGNPDQDALYLNVTPPQNDGVVPYRLTVKDVPVDGFWSVSVYNSKGYFEPNREAAYTLNNLTAKKAEDGSITIQFGSCEGGTTNCLPITPGWNYIVRLYRPRPEIVQGTWTFPQAVPVR